MISYSLEELYTGGLVCLLMCYYRVVYVIVIASSYRLGGLRLFSVDIGDDVRKECTGLEEGLCLQKRRRKIYLFFVAKQRRSYGRVDGTEVGHHSRIPLWMFGLLY